jgi:hypothetical protein
MVRRTSKPESHGCEDCSQLEEHFKKKTQEIRQQAAKSKAPTKLAAAAGRGALTAPCDFENYILSRTNGVPHTVKAPKNAGDCCMAIFCVD